MNTFILFLKRHSLVVGIILMFLFTWPIDLTNSRLLPLQVPDVVSIMGGWGFIFASLIMTGLTLGKDAVIALLQRFLIWRVHWKWYLVAFLLLPTLQFTSVLLTALLTRAPVNFNSVFDYKIFGPSANLLILIVPWFFYEAIANGEEMGWRGYILPRLQAKHNALASSLIVGLSWGVWHFPKFLGLGANSERSFPWFMVITVAAAVLYTWLYNNTRGSLLLVTLFHASGNSAGIFLPISFAAIGGIVPNLMIVLYILAAVVVVIAAGPARLSRREPKQIQETSHEQVSKLIYQV